MSRHARPPDVRRARRRRSSTRRAPRPLKKGRYARPARLRCGQEGHGPQAPHPCRHARPSARRERSARRHSRPRRGARSVAAGAPPLSVHRAHLRRRRISRAENGDDDRRHRKLDNGDRSALRPPSFRRLAEAMDRRAQLRLDQPQSALDPRFRTLRHNRRRLRAPRHDPHHAQTPDQAKPLLMNPFFLDRL